MKYVLVFLLAVLGVFLFREFQLINSEKINAWTENQKADCAVVVTGGPGRVREGIDLLHRGQIKKLVISGVNPKASLYEIFPQWPYYAGLDSKDVILERYSGTTFGNARQSLPLVEAIRCQSVLLVTSRIHMYRTRRTFLATFPEEIELKTRAIGEQDQDSGLMMIVVETIKSFFYSLWAYQ